jgi:tetratricopeptide (TPR) repeat protein
LGFIARENGDLESAVEYYSTARELSSHHFRRGFYSLTLGDIFTLQGVVDEAEKLYQSAVDDYKAALDFAIQPDLRAEYFEELSKAYERLGDIEGAIKAMREAINILPEGSLKRDIFETRLDELE